MEGSIENADLCVKKTLPQDVLCRVCLLLFEERIKWIPARVTSRHLA
jgi:hypothetical protein